VRYAVPSVLAEMLRRDELDAALVSVTEVLFQDRYDVLDGIAIAGLGEVRSVLLAHRVPIQAVTEVHCDPASLTSVNLLKVLLAERGLRPRYVPLVDAPGQPLPDAFLLIGDRAIEFLLGPREHEVWDLGAAWYEATRLPFVYAVWALRRGVDNAVLRQRLREAKVFGLETLDHIISSRTEFTLDFRKDYLGWNIHFHLGADEKRGLARFIELLRIHGLGPVHEPVFVS
jgi:chorismate dehydratase